MFDRNYSLIKNSPAMHTYGTHYSLSIGSMPNNSYLTTSKKESRAIRLTQPNIFKDIRTRDVRVNNCDDIDHFLLYLKEQSCLTKTERRTLKSKERKREKRARRKMREQVYQNNLGCKLSISDSKLNTLFPSIEKKTDRSHQVSNKKDDISEEQNINKRIETTSKFHSPNFEVLDEAYPCATGDLITFWGKQILTIKDHKSRKKKKKIKPKTTGKEWRSKSSRSHQRNKKKYIKSPSIGMPPTHLNLSNYFRIPSVTVLDGSVPNTLKSKIAHSLISFIGSAGGSIQSELGIDGHVNPRNYQGWPSSEAAVKSEGETWKNKVNTRLITSESRIKNVKKIQTYSYFLFPMADANPIPIDHWSKHNPATPEEYLKKNKPELKVRNKRRVDSDTNPESYFKIILSDIDIKSISDSEISSLKKVLEEPLSKKYFMFTDYESYQNKLIESYQEIKKLKKSNPNGYDLFKKNLLDMTAMSLTKNSFNYREIYRKYWDNAREALVLDGKNYVDENFPKLPFFKLEPQEISYKTGILSDGLLTRLLVDHFTGMETKIPEIAMIYARLDFNSYVDIAIKNQEKKLTLIPVISGIDNPNLSTDTVDNRISFDITMKNNYGIENADKGIFFSQKLLAAKGSSLARGTGTCLAFSFASMLTLENQDLDSLAELFIKINSLNNYSKITDPLVQQQIYNGMYAHNDNLQHTAEFDKFHRTYKKEQGINDLIRTVVKSDGSVALKLDGPLGGAHAIMVTNVYMPAPDDPSTNVIVKVLIDSHTGVFPCFDLHELEQQIKYSISTAYKSIDGDMFEPDLKGILMYTREIDHDELDNMRNWKTKKGYGFEDFFSKNPDYFYEYHKSTYAQEWEKIFPDKLKLSTDLHNPKYASQSIVNDLDLIRTASALDNKKIENTPGSIIKNQLENEQPETEIVIRKLKRFRERMSLLDRSPKLDYEQSMLRIPNQLYDDYSEEYEHQVKLRRRAYEKTNLYIDKIIATQTDNSIGSGVLEVGKLLISSLPSDIPPGSKVIISSKDGGIAADVVRGGTNHIDTISSQVSEIFLSDDEANILKGSLLSDSIYSINEIAEHEHHRIISEFEHIKAEISEHITSKGLSPNRYELSGVINEEIKFSYKGGVLLNDMPEAITIKGEMADKFISFRQRLSNTIEAGFSEVSSTRFLQIIKESNFAKTINSASAKGAKVMGIAAKIIALQTSTNILKTINQNNLPVTAKAELGLRLSDAIGDSLANSSGAINFVMKRLAGDLVSKFVTISPIVHSMNIGSFSVGTLVNLSVLGIQSYELHMAKTTLDREIKSIRVFMTSLTTVIQFSAMFSPHPAATMAIFAFTIMLNKIEEAIIENKYNVDLLSKDFKSFNIELKEIREVFNNPNIIFNEENGIIVIENKASFTKLTISGEGISITRDGKFIKTSFFESINESIKKEYKVNMYDLTHPENHLKNIPNSHARKIAQQTYAYNHEDVSAVKNIPEFKKDSHYTKLLAHNHEGYADRIMRSRANFVIKERIYDDTLRCIIDPHSSKDFSSNKWNLFTKSYQKYKTKPSKNKPLSIVFNGIAPKITYIEYTPKAISQKSKPHIADDMVSIFDSCSQWSAVSSNHFVTNLSGMPLASLPKVFLYEGKLVYFKTLLGKSELQAWFEKLIADDVGEWCGMSEYYGLNSPDHVILEPQDSTYSIQAGSGFIYHFTPDIQSIRAAEGKLHYFTFKNVTGEIKTYKSKLEKCDNDKDIERQKRIKKNNFKAVNNEHIESCRTLKDHFPHGFKVDQEKTKRNYESSPESTAYVLEILAKEDHQMVLHQGVKLTLSETISAKKDATLENNISEKNGQYFFFIKPDIVQEFKLTRKTENNLDHITLDRIFTFDFSISGKKPSLQEQEIVIKAKPSVTRDMMFMLPVSIKSGIYKLGMQLSINYVAENNLLEIYSINQLQIVLGELQTTNTIIKFLKGLRTNSPDIFIKTFPINSFDFTKSSYHKNTALDLHKLTAGAGNSSNEILHNAFDGYGYCVIENSVSTSPSTYLNSTIDNEPDFKNTKVIYLIYRSDTPDQIKKLIQRLGYLGNVPLEGHTIPTELSSFMKQDDRIHYFYDYESRTLVRQYGLTEVRYWVKEDFKVCPLGSDPILSSMLQNREASAIYECNPIYKENRESQEVSVMFPAILKLYQNKYHHEDTTSMPPMNIFSFIHAQSPYHDDRLYTIMGGVTEHEVSCSDPDNEFDTTDNKKLSVDLSVTMQMFVGDDRKLYVAALPRTLSTTGLLAVNTGAGYALYTYEYSQSELDALPSSQKTLLSIINNNRYAEKLAPLTPIKIVSRPLISGDLLSNFSHQVSTTSLIPRQFISDEKMLLLQTTIITVRDLPERGVFICETLEGVAFSISYDLKNKNLIALSSNFFLSKKYSPYIPEQAMAAFLLAKLQFGNPVTKFIKLSDYRPESISFSNSKHNISDVPSPDLFDRIQPELGNTQPMVFMDTTDDQLLYIPTQSNLTNDFHITTDTIVLSKLQIEDNTTAIALDNTNKLLVTVKSPSNPRLTEIIDILPLLYAGYIESTFHLSLVPTNDVVKSYNLPNLSVKNLMLLPVLTKQNMLYSPVLIIPPLMQNTLHSIILDSSKSALKNTKTQRISLNTGNNEIRSLIIESNMERKLILIVKANNEINKKIYKSINQALQIVLLNCFLDNGEISPEFNSVIFFNETPLTIEDLTILATKAKRKFTEY